VTTFASTLNSPAEQRHIERLIVETFDATLVEGNEALARRAKAGLATQLRPDLFPSASVVQKLWEDK
jgi:hypothetical protein